MEYLTGKTEKKTLGIQDILAGEYEGKEVTVNGAVHKIRDMGDVAFVVLRKFMKMALRIFLTKNCRKKIPFV